MARRPTNTSFSGVGGADPNGPMTSWGADYNLEGNAFELPGSGGSPATLAYTLGAIGTTLTFTNVGRKRRRRSPPTVRSRSSRG